VSYSDGSPGGALHWKIHHAIGDGISLASLLLGCVDGGVPEVPGTHGLLPSVEVTINRSSRYVTISVWYCIYTYMLMITYI
jgi:hypothetical protein